MTSDFVGVSKSPDTREVRGSTPRWPICELKIVRWRFGAHRALDSVSQRPLEVALLRLDET
jgi:hypothetical protein